MLVLCSIGEAVRLRRIAIFERALERGWWVILLVILGGVSALGVFLPDIGINANTDAFLQEDDPGIKAYYEIRQEWGTDEFALVCVTADDWFTPAGIKRLKKIEEELKEVPYVASIMSILDVPLLRQRPQEKVKLLRLKDRMTSLREPEVFLETAATELKDHELATGNLISADGRSLNLLAYLEWDPEETTPEPSLNVRREKLVAGVRELAARWNGKLSDPVHLSGIPLIQRAVFENLRHDLVIFGLAALLLFSLALMVVYRDPWLVLLPLLCCLLPVVGILGAMSAFGIELALVTSNMPVLLFVLMLPYTVYFLERYRERYQLSPEMDGLSLSMAAVRSIFVPCLFSCATTLAGFLALSTSKITPIQEFGRIMSVGMLVGFLLVFLFLPTAMSRLRPSRIVKRKRDEEGVRLGGLVRIWLNVTLAKPVVVVILALLVMVMALLGASQLTAQSKFTGYFWPKSETYQGLKFVDQKVGGTTWIEVVLSSKEEKAGYFKSRAGLQALRTVEEYFETVPETGNVLSLHSLVKEMRKTVTRERYPLLADSLLLTAITPSSKEMIEETTTRNYTISRVTIRMKETAPTLHRGKILAGLDDHLKEHAEVFEEVDVLVTGVFPLYADLQRQLFEGQRQSVFLVPLAVFLMLLLLFRSAVFAVLVLIPQALPATVLLGIMGWAGIPLDLVTVMIAAIAIGVGIDASIQYAMRYREEWRRTGNHEESVARAHATIGRAIWKATSIIVAGFAILALSDFFPTFWFGVFTAGAMVLSQLATLTVLPSLFLLTRWPRSSSKNPESKGSQGT